jgi:anti-sigma-K factor RskA
MSRSSREPECMQSGQAAAYVLWALGDEEAQRYREHLNDCASCNADVARLQPVADSLSAAVPRMVAPEELRERVMATVRPEAELLKAAGAGADRPPASSRRRSRRLRFVAVAGALGIGVVFGAVVVDTGSKAPVTHVTSAQLASSPPGAKAFVRQTGSHGELVISGESQPPPGKIYEVWLARKGAPQATNALFGVDRGGNASVDVPGNLADVRQVLVTAEPLGGSAHPTSTPIIVATLPS